MCGKIIPHRPENPTTWKKEYRSFTLVDVFLQLLVSSQIFEFIYLAIGFLLGSISSRWSVTSTVCSWHTLSSWNSRYFILATMCLATDGHFGRSLYIIVFLARWSAVNRDDYDLLSLLSLSINVSCHDDVTCCCSYAGVIGSTSFTYRIVVIVYLVQAVSLRQNIAVPRGQSSLQYFWSAEFNLIRIRPATSTRVGTTSEAWTSVLPWIKPVSSNH